MAGFWTDLIGTTMSYLMIGRGGVRLKNSAGALQVRNAADSADAALTASAVNVSGDTITLNSDKAGTGADWKIDIKRPSTGMTADWALTLPATPGSANQVLQTDGSGNATWASAASTTACSTDDTTSLAFGSSSPVAMFTLPANAVIDEITVCVDTAFNGTTPTMTIGITGTTSKYAGSTDVDLTVIGQTKLHPGVAPVGTTEALIITYSGGSSSAGAARIIVSYSIPA